MKRGDTDDAWMSRTFVVAACLIALAVTTMARSFTLFPNDAEHFSESFGPMITNECDQTVIAAMGVSVEVALGKLGGHSHTRIVPGDRSRVEYRAASAAVPTTLSLVIGVGNDDPVRLDLATRDIRGNRLELVFKSDCVTLVEK